MRSDLLLTLTLVKLHFTKMNVNQLLKFTLLEVKILASGLFNPSHHIWKDLNVRKMSLHFQVISSFSIK